MEGRVALRALFMSYATLDTIADSFWIVFALSLALAALWKLRARGGSFLLRAALSVALCQQVSKFIQKRDGFGLGHHFPSTHFAVALALMVGFWVLGRRFGLAATLATLGYGALMLWQRYHAPAEMLGAFFAVPVALACQWKPKKAPVAAH